MNNEMVDNLFRADVRTKRKGTEGEPRTGIGLLLCKEFVKKQGGKIWVKGEEGKGSVFYFAIPHNADREVKNVIENIVPASEKDTQNKSLKILFVENDD